MEELEEYFKPESGPPGYSIARVAWRMFRRGAQRVTGSMEKINEIAMEADSARHHAREAGDAAQRSAAASQRVLDAMKSGTPLRDDDTPVDPRGR